MPSFVHLHVHSTYSLLDGLSSIDGIIETAKSFGMDSIAITDHGVMYGAIEFYERARKAKINPIIGVEAYLAPQSRFDRKTKSDERAYHLVLLAKNYQGYLNLLKLTTIAHLEGYYYKPRIDWQVLEEHHEGLIALSACLQGPLSRRILSQRMDEAKKEALKFAETFGDENFYLEVQSHPGIPEQKIVNDALINLSRELGLKLVATNDSHYLKKEDAMAQDILLCLQNKKLLSDKDRMSFIGEDFSLKSSEEMADKFIDLPEALENTAKIASLCRLEIPTGRIILPRFEVPEGYTPQERLKYLCEQGAKDRYGENFTKEAGERLEYELSVIEKMGFESYFLIVADFVNWAKSNGIVTGPGRGSAAGSIVSYLTNITNVDPLKYGLLFERFLNPERVSMPDIDLDFADTRRDEVLNYVSQKYGQDRVCQIITFGTMAARASIRDVGRVLGLSYEYCDRIAKLIPMFYSLDKALDEVQELKKIYNEDSEAKKLIETAKKLEGVARHASRHACGVIITPEPLTNYLPLQYASSDDREIVSQYSLHSVESIGLLKMDFLGLSNLTTIQNAINLIKKTRGCEIDPENLPLSDKKTFDLLKSGETTGVFQLESQGMRRYLKQLKPTELNDIIAMVSLYRPGPMELIPDYIAGKHGEKKPSYLSPILEPILKETYGIAIYQEQIQRIACDFAGFTLGEGYMLIKAVAKKIKSLLDEQKNKFTESAVKRGHPKSLAEKLFSFIEPFARYGFNKSHATCYALIAFETAYLKANFPQEFMASLLTSDQDNIDRISIEIEECRRVGIQVLPPDVNESEDVFSVVIEEGKPAQKIRFGLKAIKNLGANISETIIGERKANGKFKDLEDFLYRINSKDLNKKSLESLMKAGALDSFADRSELLFNTEKLLHFVRNKHAGSSSGQTDLFAGAVVSMPRLRLDKVPQDFRISELEKLQWEREHLGVFLSRHPLNEFEGKLPHYVKKISEMREAESDGGRESAIAGMVVGIKKMITKTKQNMAFARVEDQSGGIEAIVFPKMLEESEELWREGKMLLIKGKISLKDQDVKILVDSVYDLEKSAPPAPQSGAEKVLTVEVHHPRANPRTFDALKRIFYDNPGKLNVHIKINGENGQGQVIKTNSKISLSNDVEAELVKILGEKSFYLNERT